MIALNDKKFGNIWHELIGWRSGPRCVISSNDDTLEIYLSGVYLIILGSVLTL